VRRIAIATLCAVLVASGGWGRPVPARAQAAPGGDPSGDDGPGPEEALTQRIAVWRLDALGIEAELVARLETLFRSELDRLAKSPLPSRREMDRAVGKDRTLRDCTGEDKCLTTIGEKVGVDVMVTGSVAALGESYILDIKAVDVKSGKQLRRIATDPLRGSPDELIEGVRVAAYSLLAPDQLYGSIVVLSDLVGASVSLDGKKVGPTPLPGPIAKQSLGKHRLKVEAKGYQPFDEEVEVRFQKSTRVVVRLATAEPVDGDAPRVVVREEKRPWWTSKWAYVGAGVLAIGVGALIGWQLGKDEVVSCIPPSMDPRCAP
jgi:hypothetical protein